MTTSLEKWSVQNPHNAYKFDSHSVNTGLDGDTGIIHVAANVSENL
jgi:hypothetical protein